MWFENIYITERNNGGAAWGNLWNWIRGLI